ncbi:probable starch synthase 4, chloroplastic/amyloplastic isoform X2 [Beta vulgaris subsp. vulgaris]|uniref:probable starch synthase 4, chloroplastic/amyloplastic isoform X2 n=1 Tax=Beta vulgaris subsp. vulgaris TaxID=3555 RepID=UPI00203764C4|nr:probable starch synthase 4, chloroplastic/amyloplastic isoform X2 [Beta vulgaris subsp. vulgaris]
MAAKLHTCFLSHGLIGLNSKHSNLCSADFSRHSHRLPPASCKIRQRNVSSQHKRRQVKKSSPEKLRIDANLKPNGEDAEFGNASINGVSSSKQGSMPKNGVDNSVVNKLDNESNSLSLLDDKVLMLPPPRDNSLTITQLDSSSMQHNDDINADPKSLSLNLVGAKQLSSIQLKDLINMIRSAEKNVLLLNQARVRALEDLEKILQEKEALQGDIDALELKLTETDARIKIATQEKIHVELLQDELEKMRKEVSKRSDAEEVHDISYNKDHKSLNSDFYSLSNELSALKAENASLKDDIEALRAELSNVSITDGRVTLLEKERMYLESTVKDLELKLEASQEDVKKLSMLEYEYNSLCEKVHNLQALLDNATKQAEHAVVVLQQNQELRKKVERLEESYAEGNVYKLSSEKMQQYNELMQQKVKLLEERLERSDEEINSYVDIYQESMKEFQDTLNNLKQGNEEKVVDGPVYDMPWEFWSQMLLMVDGWLLEKKLSSNDAKLLREMVWKRESCICDAYLECEEKTEREMLAKFLSLTSASTRSALHVIHIAAEMAPVAKVGGLGDVVTGLSKALQKKGHLVEIVLPKYDCMQYDLIQNLRALDVEVESYFDGQLYKNKIWIGTVEGLPVYFIEPYHPDKFFWRGQHYGENDDFKRFSFFSRAALELLLQAGKKPDIIHCHDWQTAFVAPLYWDLYAPKGLNSARICFTCHNFEYQGTAPASELASCGLDVYQLNRTDRMQDNSADDRINPVKGGKGLHTTLNSHSKKFIGILNGIDTDTWNPATDSRIEVQYNASDLQGKMANKQALRRLLGLRLSDSMQPLVGCITRLVPQKGVHLIRHAIYRTIELGGQFVLLGSSPVHHIQREFEGIANQFQNHDNARLILKYDESLSRSIYAASDIFIIPSIFEPCGLTQMIAMRYGAIPIVRKTGGLNDSVFDVDDDTIPPQFRNGFTFLSPDEQGFNSALDRAIQYYKNDRESWEQLVQKVMSIDFSWDSSSGQYEELYAKSVARARAAKRA